MRHTSGITPHSLHLSCFYTLFSPPPPLPPPPPHLSSLPPSPFFSSPGSKPTMLISGSSLFEVFPLPSPLLIVRLKCHSIQGHPTHTAGATGTIFRAICVSRTRHVKSRTANVNKNTFVAYGGTEMGAKSALLETPSTVCTKKNDNLFMFVLWLHGQFDQY